MKIGILVAGPLPDDIAAKFGTFDTMFKDLLLKQDPDLTFKNIWFMKMSSRPRQRNVKAGL